MEDRVRNHPEHTYHSIFHHGLIKLLVVKELENKPLILTQFLFWLGFKVEKPEYAEEQDSLETSRKLRSYKRKSINKT